ncbi:M23 family metallopeptidase [Trichocoleus sp. FACHB-591]|uniref:M23 family metallopeptidase n=1 Tax=Trichocoleus sp. FACHB-591 TaxID=2692872 RepID=UPI0016827126|nr:M23 family metallopeptidase [Trichocoleus sp. FACHB-591]MBD2093933.1 M23 family metallopeptidase [Trichocoleus sp. FACHB-591]
MTIPSLNCRPLQLLLTASLTIGSLAAGLLDPAIATPQNYRIQVTTNSATGSIKLIQVPVPSYPVAASRPSSSKPNFAWPTDSSLQAGYIWPVKGVVTSGFGPRWGRMHNGIDIAGPVGAPIQAAADGIVISAGWNQGGYGNLVKIQHLNGSVTFYAHNQRLLVQQGQQVRQGQIIAELGSTGNSTGPHCHFEIRPQGQSAVNPIAYLPSTVAQQFTH